MQTRLLKRGQVRRGEACLARRCDPIGSPVFEIRWK